MRTIVVGPLNTTNGIQQIAVWFRFPASGARQTYYAKQQASSQPVAPGDYSGVDSAEVTALQSGSFVERQGFFDVIDPTATLANIQARLVNIYNAASTAFTAADNSTLARWASSFDGTTWSMKSS
jgi:hypothetical protein